MPISSSPDKNLHKYLLRSRRAPRSATRTSIHLFQIQQYSLVYGNGPKESLDFPSLFPSPFSISAFNPAKQALLVAPLPASSPSLFSNFWQSKEDKNISALLRAKLTAALEMILKSNKKDVVQSYRPAKHRNTQQVYEMSTLGFQSAEEMECCNDQRHLYGLELERQDTEEDKGNAQVGGNQHSKYSSGQKSLDDTPKLLLAGAVSTIVSRTFVAPLERLKLEYIVRGARDGWMKIIHFIWVSEGFAGFWKGNALNLFRMVPFKSINFLTYDMYCNWLLAIPGKEEITNYDRLAAGAVSGIAATMLCLPMDTIRTRLVAPGGESLGGIIGCFQHMVHTEGFFSLYKGLMPTLLSMAPAGAVFYGVYDILKAAYLGSPKEQGELRQQVHADRKGDNNIKECNDSSNEMELGPIRTLVYGAIAGACAEIVTYPLEVVRRQLQLQETMRLGLIATFTSIIKQDGASALFAGVVPSTLQVLPSAALSYLIYEFMKVKLKIS